MLHGAVKPPPFPKDPVIEAYKKAAGDEGEAMTDFGSLLAHLPRA